MSFPTPCPTIFANEPRHMPPCLEVSYSQPVPLEPFIVAVVGFWIVLVLIFLLVVTAVLVRSITSD